MKKAIYLLFASLILLMVFSCNSVKQKETKTLAERWSVDKAKSWGDSIPWMAGADFLPSTAINQLEMWQAESFDTATIKRELGFAQGIGMKVMRVYLHHLAWEIDSLGFKNRMESYLQIASSKGISTVFVFFDDCWNPTYKAGKQPDPKPGIHNSGWVRDPGDLIFTDTTLIAKLEIYVKDILSTFSNDKRILIWDLYNEPGNSGYENKSMNLLQKVFSWAREINPSQPVSVGVWKLELKDLNKFQVENSDIITYHNYDDSTKHQNAIDSLRKYNRPIVCTEYMRRPVSVFNQITPMLKKENIIAINWGLVSGRSNTIYAWDTPIPDGSEPKIWFHDIFRKDGTAFDSKEIEIIKALTAD